MVVRAGQGGSNADTISNPHTYCDTYIECAPNINTNGDADNPYSHAFCSSNRNSDRYTNSYTFNGPNPYSHNYSPLRTAPVDL